MTTKLRRFFGPTILFLVGVLLSQVLPFAGAQTRPTTTAATTRAALPPYLPPGERTMIQQWETQWFNVRDGVPAASLPVNWDWLRTQVSWDYGEPGASFNTARGRIGAHRFERTGDHKVVATASNALGTFTREYHVNVVRETKTQVKVKTFADLVKFGANPAYVLDGEGRTFEFTQSVKLGYGSRAKNLHAVANKNIGSFFTPTGNNTVLDSTFTCPYFAKYEGEKAADGSGAPSIMKPRDRSTVFHCTGYQIGTMVNCETFPTYVFVANNVAPLEHGMRGYLVWGQGRMIVEYGNTARNAVGGAHDTRFGGVVDGVLYRNDFTNLDTRVGATNITDGSFGGKTNDQWDQPRNAITIHLTSGIDMIENVCRSQGIQVGPLGGGDGVTKPDWQTLECSDIQVIDNVCDYLSDCRFLIDPGTNGVWIKGNKFSTPTRNPIQLNDTDKKGYTVKVGSTTVVRYYKRPDGSWRDIRNVYIEGDNVLTTRAGDPLTYVPANVTNVINAFAGRKATGYHRFSSLPTTQPTSRPAN
jgi:hypothetical protein